MNETEPWIVEVVVKGSFAKLSHVPFDALALPEAVGFQGSAFSGQSARHQITGENNAT